MHFRDANIINSLWPVNVEQTEVHIQVHSIIVNFTESILFLKYSHSLLQNILVLV